MAVELPKRQVTRPSSLLLEGNLGWPRGQQPIVSRDVMSRHIVDRVTFSAGNPYPTDEFGLTKRQKEVLLIWLDGQNIVNIASRLAIGESAVKANLDRVQHTWGVGRAGLRAEAVRQGLIKEVEPEAFEPEEIELGEPELSDEDQTKILLLMAQDASIEDIATSLAVDKNTLLHYMSTIYSNLDIDPADSYARQHLLLKAVEMGQIEVPPLLFLLGLDSKERRDLESKIDGQSNREIALGLAITEQSVTQRLSKVRTDKIPSLKWTQWMPLYVNLDADDPRVQQLQTIFRWKRTHTLYRTEKPIDFVPPDVIQQLEKWQSRILHTGSIADPKYTTRFEKQILQGLDARNRSESIANARKVGLIE